MKVEQVKIGIVGLGRGAYVGGYVVGLRNACVRAICDINPKKIEEAKKKFIEEKGIPEEELLVFDNYDEMLKSDINTVIIATEAIYHVPFVLKALEAGKHVFSEIPTVNSLEEAKILRKAVKAHPELKYMAGENCCYWAFIDQWKHMYDNGEFGDIVYAESEYLHSQDFREFKEEDYPKGHWRQFSPAIKYVTHNLGPLLYIMNDRCVSVTCMEPDVVYNPYRVRPQNGVALFKTAKGAVIRIMTIFDAYLKFDHNFAMIGTRGTIETDKIKGLGEAHSYARLDSVPGSFRRVSGAKVEIPVTMQYPMEKIENGGHGGADGKMIKAFVECIQNDTPSPIDVDLGIRMSLPGIYAAESADNGSALLTIPDPEDFED
ncbi:MAG: Gfo/Idh/MocA family oxidoreductase [Clostridia bacterium]|nr:Gfo/Idh/MocA family oxidoreductase [Clostridia bacterium]